MSPSWYCSTNSRSHARRNSGVRLSIVKKATSTGPFAMATRCQSTTVIFCASGAPPKSMFTKR